MATLTAFPRLVAGPPQPASTRPAENRVVFSCGGNAGAVGNVQEGGGCGGTDELPFGDTSSADKLTALSCRRSLPQISMCSKTDGGILL